MLAKSLRRTAGFSKAEREEGLENVVIHRLMVQSRL